MNTSAPQETRTLRIFLIRGVIAIAWALIFTAVANSLTTDLTVVAGVLLILYPLIDAVATLIDARTQRGSARQLHQRPWAMPGAAAGQHAGPLDAAVCDQIVTESHCNPLALLVVSKIEQSYAKRLGQLPPILSYSSSPQPRSHSVTLCCSCAPPRRSLST